MNMISDARGGHVSPGMYTEEKDVTYSVKSLGITSLGLAGETLYGPAFENIPIKDWTEFVDYFGGTSPEKFKGTGLPKYELPYVAKSYLEESKNLNVVRVLGLSGYHAGPAWVLSTSETDAPVIILRSKMRYKYSSDICEAVQDAPEAIVESIERVDYTPKTYTAECATKVSGATSEDLSKEGKFGLKVTMKSGVEGYESVMLYNVSLNANDSDYIYTVLSSSPSTGSTPIYIDAVYEATWSSLAKSAITSCVKLDTDEYDDFRDMYRPAQTPWIVSNAEIAEYSGDTVVTKGTMRKLFKFITISDGDASNYQVKVSVQNINPIDGTFDVVVRDFNDTDAAPSILEKFSKCNLVDGDSNYIAYKIGTYDGGFVAKSKYITVEMADNLEDINTAVPAGFLGFPMPKYGDARKAFNLAYNTVYDVDVKAKRQYFGMSDRGDGIDTDILSYKGVSAYTSGDANIDKICNGFHLDAGLAKCTEGEIYVDGKSGYTFSCVSDVKVGSETYIPRLIANEGYLDLSIYKDANVRKFTTCFYGGFDGWDVNRESRTNTDDYKASKYNISGSTVFSKVTENGLNQALNLPTTAITSDYYAYLAGYRVFANPQDVDINLLATPGIDWGRNSLLTEDVIDIVEDADDGRGGDALYIANAPMLSGDGKTEVTVAEAIDQFETADFSSSYFCTYFPWVMFYDSSNKKYLNLPVTKDVVRNMAQTDNNSYPWFAPAGINRGDVRCVKAVFKTTLADEDDLYEANINPVKSFAQDGVKIWGNKTGYQVDSPLNRINVRRLMIRVKKLIQDAALSLIFEQYDDTLEKQFKGIVEPILADVKSNRGIYDYRVITECTEETRDQHILPAKILIKPTPALEYISISFVVYPESVEFEE